MPPKSLVSLGFEGIPNFLTPTPFTWKTATPPEFIRTRKFEFMLLFLACLRRGRGGSLRDGFGGLTVRESTLPSFRLSYKIQDKEATVMVVKVVTVSAVVAVSVVTATPSTSTALFSYILIRFRVVDRVAFPVSCYTAENPKELQLVKNRAPPHPTRLGVK